MEFSLSYLPFTMYNFEKGHWQWIAKVKSNAIPSPSSVYSLPIFFWGFILAFWQSHIRGFYLFFVCVQKKGRESMGKKSNFRVCVCVCVCGSLYLCLFSACELKSQLDEIEMPQNTRQRRRGQRERGKTVYVFDEKMAQVWDLRLWTRRKQQRFHI
jgi:hypothetical protein